MNIKQKYCELIEATRCYFHSQVTLPLSWRKQQLKQLQKLIITHEAELTKALTTDLGKPVFEAYTTELAQVRSEVDYLLSHLKHLAAPQTVRVPMALMPATAFVKPEPYGVVCIIGPWNYPIALVLNPLAAAIAAGNCALVKVSEHAPACAELLSVLIPRYLDKKAYHIIKGGSEECSTLLDYRFDYLFFTGSTKIGRLVMQKASRHLTPLTLELGGKSPCIIDKHCSLPVTARRIAWGKWLNAGQSCVAPDYLLVHSSIKKALVAELISAIKELYGEQIQSNPNYGRIVNAQHFTRLKNLLKNQQIIFGGQCEEEKLFIAPTIIDEVDDTNALMDEEIFGPLLPIIEINSIQEAIVKISTRAKPLALYLFSDNAAHQKLIQETTSSGGLCINDTVCHLGVTELPFGGVGESGMGAYHGKAGFDTFSHKKSVFKRSFSLDNPLRYPPYTERQLSLAKLFM